MSSITLHAEGCKKPAFLTKKVLSIWLREVVSAYSYEVGTISFIFCTDGYILEMNRQYLQHDYYTDVITFDYTEGKVISGDIFISLDTVASNACEYNVSFEEELFRVIVHGVLHLIGFKDATDVQQTEMRQAEDKALKALKQLF